jgi:hypothetical protein
MLNKLDPRIVKDLEAISVNILTLLKTPTLKPFLDTITVVD